MQTLVVYHKSNNRIIASFKYNSFITEAEVLMLPGLAYLITFNADIFYKDNEGHYCVKVGEQDEHAHSNHDTGFRLTRRD